MANQDKIILAVLGVQALAVILFAVYNFSAALKVSLWYIGITGSIGLIVMFAELCRERKGTLNIQNEDNADASPVKAGE